MGVSVEKNGTYPKKNIKARLSFANALKSTDVQYLKRIFFNDETKINRIGPDGKTFVHREKTKNLIFGTL